MTEQSRCDRINRASNDILDATSFLSGTNAQFIEGLYARYLANPESVDEGWRAYFADLGEQGLSPTQLGRGPGWHRDGKLNLPQDDITLALSGGQGAAKPAPKKSAAAPTAAPAADGESTRATALDSIRAIPLV